MKYAIIGTGPSAADIHDRELLLKSRTLVVLNGAAAFWPEATYMVMSEPSAFHKFVQLAKYPMTLVVTNTAFNHNMARRARLRIFDTLFYIHSPTLGRLNSCPTAMEFLHTRHGVTEVELYGIDFGEPGNAIKDNEYGKQGKAAAGLAEQLGMKVTNCCPSTHSQHFPVEGRPWTEGTKATPPPGTITTVSGQT